MSRALSARLRRVETALRPARVIVVEGYSDQERTDTIAAMKARGDAADHDLFVCLMRFGERATP